MNEHCFLFRQLKFRGLCSLSSISFVIINPVVFVLVAMITHVIAPHSCGQSFYHKLKIELSEVQHSIHIPHNCVSPSNIRMFISHRWPYKLIADEDGDINVSYSSVLEWQEWNPKLHTTPIHIHTFCCHSFRSLHSTTRSRQKHFWDIFGKFSTQSLYYSNVTRKSMHTEWQQQDGRKNENEKEITYTLLVCPESFQLHLFMKCGVFFFFMRARARVWMDLTMCHALFGPSRHFALAYK